MRYFQIIFLILISAILSACAGDALNCGVYERGSKEFRECRAQEGSKEHMFRLGVEYYVAGEFNSAKQMFESAVKNEYKRNNKDYSLAHSTVHDRVFRSDVEIAENGNKPAAFMLSLLYDEGAGVEKNEMLSQRYRERAGRYIVEISETINHHRVQIKNRAFYPNENGDYKYYDTYSFNIAKNG